MYESLKGDISVDKSIGMYVEKLSTDNRRTIKNGHVK